MRKYIMEKKEIEKELREIIKNGGEGVMIRRPNSLYQNGRSLSLFKIKVCSFIHFY